jgi:hypothetical protein
LTKISKKQKELKNEKKSHRHGHKKFNSMLLRVNNGVLGGGKLLKQESIGYNVNWVVWLASLRKK